MKITHINTYLSAETHRNFIFIEVVTDEGLSGVGEAYCVGPDHAIVDTVKYFEHWIKGMDPRNITGIWQKVYSFSRFPGGSIILASLSGIEIALWDIAGKAAGLPVWALLGGKCRDSIPVYGHVRYEKETLSDRGTSELAETALKIIDKYKYSSVKIFPLMNFDSAHTPWAGYLKEAENRYRVLRETLGDDIEIAIDTHGYFLEPVKAIEFAERIKPYRPFFFEEPIRPENIDALARVARKVDIPIATGEMLYTKWAFRELLVKEAADIVQPDVALTGGILEVQKIAALAESFFVKIAPHNPLGPVATAAYAHLCATITNFLTLEYLPDDTPERTDVVYDPVKLKDGCLVIPDSPGLGIELNKEGIKAHPPQVWHRRFRHFPDGFPSYI